MLRKKKILFVYYKLFKPGGIARVLTNLVNNLAEDYDVSILVLMDKHEPVYQLDPRIELIFVNSFSHKAFTIGCVGMDRYFGWLPKKQNIKNYLYDFGAYQTVNKWLVDNHSNYDTIVTCMYKLSIGASSNNQFNYKTIGWEHSDADVPSVFWKSLRKKNSRRLKNIIAINSRMEQFYKQISPNTKLIYNLMNSEVENEEPISFQEKENTILLVANFFPEKNVEGFLQIIHNSKIPTDWNIKIIGDGELKKEISDSIHSKKLSSKVQLLGNLPYAKVLIEMRKAKILCLTSLKESFSLVLVEAMFCGCSLISYKCNGPNNIINDQNGYLIDLHDQKTFIDKLEYLINHPKELEKLSNSSFLEAQKWKKEILINQWKEIL